MTRTEKHSDFVEKRTIRNAAGVKFRMNGKEFFSAKSLRQFASSTSIIDTPEDREKRIQLYSERAENGCCIFTGEKINAT